MLWRKRKEQWRIKLKGKYQEPQGKTEITLTRLSGGQPTRQSDSLNAVEAANADAVGRIERSVAIGPEAQPAAGAGLKDEEDEGGENEDKEDERGD